MDQELKEYLDNFKKGLATKADLEKLADKIDNIKKEMATKTDLKEVHNSLLSYLEHIDENMQEHIHTKDAHKKVLA